jgi:hypothetical protein
MPDKKTRKVKMQVSIAGATFAYQPGQVVNIDSDLAEKWIRGGHAVPAGKNEPLSSPDLLADLTAEEALRRTCTHCERRARFVLRNKPYCQQHFRSELEA